MIGQQQIDQLRDSTAYDSAGEKIGSVRQVFVDDATGQPGWVSVHTGLFGMSESFVPVHDARFDGDRLVVGVDKQRVKEAPRIEPRTDEGGRELIDDTQVAELYHYYNLPYASEAGRERADLQGRRTEPATGHRRQQAGPDDTLEATRYEEQMRVGKEPVTTGKVRLRKYVTTEDVTTTVPVRHEEVRVEREPVTGGKADPGHEFAEEEAETTLHAERPVVETESVPVEKVRMSKQTRTTEEQVGGQVRKEHVEVEDETQSKGRRGRGSNRGGTSGTGGTPKSGR